MSILIGQDTRVLVQGITGREGEFQTLQMIAYGTKVVGGVRPGKGGDWAAGVPVFDTARDAVTATGANTAVLFVPARHAVDAIYEQAEAGIHLIVCITEGIPQNDMLQVKAYLDRKQVRMIGPNCPGLITPGAAKVGIIPGHIVTPGKVGVVSRSGTLTYEVVYELTRRGIGQSTCVGIGGDPIIGTTFLDVLEMFERDPYTEQVVLIGEIGGSDEEAAAEYIGATMTKPVTAFIAGRTAPEGKRMGHAGAIISGRSGRAEDKIAALEAVGVKVAAFPTEVADLVAQRV